LPVGIFPFLQDRINNVIEFFRIVCTDAVSVAIYHEQLNCVRAGDIENGSIRGESDCPAMIVPALQNLAGFDFRKSKPLMNNTGAKIYHDRIIINSHDKRKEKQEHYQTKNA
jgi:hypothetical protein